MSAVPTVSGWRVYVTNGEGLFSPLVNGFDRAVNRSQDAVCLCHPPCREVPGPTGRCGWWATEDVFDLHDVVVGLSMLTRRREDMRRDLRGGLYDLALTGVEITFPLSTPMSPTSSAERRRIRSSVTVGLRGVVDVSRAASDHHRSHRHDARRSRGRRATVIGL